MSRRSRTLRTSLGALVLVAALTSPVRPAAADGDVGGGGRPSGILRAAGQQIVDDAGRPVALRGVAFGNAVWSDVELPTAHHGEVDYRRVRAMGMNLVRFYLNYRTFEDDANPGVWKEAGFRWIDQNVAWARRYGIRLQLNMHVPQGGFQSLGRGVALWNDLRNQDRLTALWREIARRYRAEPVVLGYDLLNEPVTAGEKVQWVQLANRLVRAIREVDPWHVVTVERLNGSNADGSGAYQPVQDADLGFFPVDDPNILYEFHTYRPIEFTHQFASWMPCCQAPTSYPDPSAISVSWDHLSWRHWTFDGTPPAGALRVPDGSTPWTAYRVRYTVTDPTWHVGRPTFMSQRNAGTVYFDDFEVREYDPQGDLVRQLAKGELEDPASWHLWLDQSTPQATGTRVVGPDGHAGTRSVGISGTNTDASLSSDAYWFRVRAGHTYELTYWARGQDSAAGSTSLGRLEFLTSSVPVIGREKALLAAELDRYASWARAHDVPLYLGEFGTVRDSFDRGGARWVADMLDLLATRGISWTYHSYRGDGGFGIYHDEYPNPVDPANANDVLVDLFRGSLAP
ncbi:glycoside hydrolase family 5 protein [Plantactinospora sp. WMMB782]|uniref:glycoside hydrolase family 5 protein n=1 Tax=Plantactinospora sp. WMMB782 TaxID=3404121 RepID=UPI003B9470C6